MGGTYILKHSVMQLEMKNNGTKDQSIPLGAIR